MIAAVTDDDSLEGGPRYEFHHLRKQRAVSPRKVVGGDSVDQRLDLFGYRGPADPATATQFFPRFSKAAALPGERRGEFDEYQSLPPFGPMPREPRSGYPVDLLDTRLPRRSSIDRELLSQHYNLKMRRTSGTERGNEETKKCWKDRRYCHALESEADAKANRSFPGAGNPGQINGDEFLGETKKRGYSCCRPILGDGFLPR